MARTLAGAGPERTNRLILIGAIALAVVAAVLVFAGLSSFGGGGGSTAIGSTVSVVIATQDIAPGTKITSDMLETAVIPQKSAIQDVFTDKAPAEGLIARYPLQAHEQVTATKLGQGSGNVPGITDLIPTGLRAFSIPIDEKTSVGGLILPGDHVDVTAVFTKGNADGNSATLLQNVLVLAVGQNAAKATTRLDSNGNPLPADQQSVGAPSDTDPNAKAKSITVAVNPQDIAALALATDQGTIYLSLRPPGDASAVPSTAGQPADAGAPAP
jgi:pilus assembly protein CpaB